MDPQKKVDMDTAGGEFAIELCQALENPILRPGVEKVQELWKKWYMSAGHRRMGRLLKDMYVEKRGIE